MCPHEALQDEFSLLCSAVSFNYYELIFIVPDCIICICAAAAVTLQFLSGMSESLCLSVVSHSVVVLHSDH